MRCARSAFVTCRRLGRALTKAYLARRCLTWPTAHGFHQRKQSAPGFALRRGFAKSTAVASPSTGVDAAGHTQQCAADVAVSLLCDIGAVPRGDARFKACTGRFAEAAQSAKQIVDVLDMTEELLRHACRDCLPRDQRALSADRLAWASDMSSNSRDFHGSRCSKYVSVVMFMGVGDQSV